MTNWQHCFYIHLFFFSFIQLSQSQIGVPLTGPRLTAVTPVNSTALTVTWEFYSSAYDRSDLIQMSIEFYEFYFNYGPINTSISYTFTSVNKTITSLTKNFDLVNAFYYVCLSSNSTNTNSSSSLYQQACQLNRTCSRLNSSVCSQVAFVIISDADVTSSSFIINVHWLKNLLYSRNATIVQLTNNGIIGTSLPSIENATYTTLPYQFSGLQSTTNYTIDIIVNYTIFNRMLTDIINYDVLTSYSSNLLRTGNSWTFIACSVLLSFPAFLINKGKAL